jgi:hypothetical protein
MLKLHAAWVTSKEYLAIQKDQEFFIPFALQCGDPYNVMDIEHVKKL